MLVKHDESHTAILKQQVKRREQVVAAIEEIQHLPAFEEACEYYGLTPLDAEQGRDSWEQSFLADVKKKMIRGSVLSEKQIAKLNDVFTGDKISSDATDKQKSYLVRLGYEGDLDDLTKDEASNQISILKDRIYG